MTTAITPITIPKILFVVLVMTALSLVSLSIKDATDKASKETYSSITNSFMIEINRRVNQGTPRGSGNVRRHNRAYAGNYLIK